MRISAKSRYAIRAVYTLIVLGGEVEAVPLKKSDYEGISPKISGADFFTAEEK